MLDAVSSGLDAVSGVLGGAAPGAPGGPAAMTFFKGENLGLPEAEQAGAQAPEERRPIDGGAPIEFIHFGYAHPDTSKNFSHADLADDAVLTFGPAGKSHAIMFRSALEREALLLAGFIASTQGALEDLENAKGGLGEMVGMAADMLGGGGGAAAPKASDMNAFGTAVKTGITPVNAAALTYKAIHKAGIDLHQARADYRAFLLKLKTPPKGDPASALLGKLPMMPGIPPVVADTLNFITGIAFKPFDVYLGFYSRLAEELEPPIERAVRRYSVDAILGQKSPVFYLWYPPPPAPDTPAGGGGGGGGTGIPFLDNAKAEFDRIKNTVEGYADKVKDWLEAGAITDPAPGAAYLSDAFQITTPPPPPGMSPAPPKELAGLILAGFKSTLEINSLPSFVERIIIEITAMNNEFLLSVFQKLMERPAVEPIREEDMYTAARKRLLDRLVGLVMDQVAFLRSARDFPFSVQGQQLAPGKALLEHGEEELNEEVLRHLNVALELTMGELVDRLESVRQEGVKANAVAMELYLGLFPLLLALNFRNTFFPVWDLIVDNTFGKLSGPMGDVVKKAKQAMKDAKDKVDKARNVAARLKKIKDRATNQGLQVGLGGQNLTGFQQDWAYNLPPDQVPVPPKVIRTFPFAQRLNKSSGTQIKKSEWDQVKGDHKYEAASDPVSA